ncbi:MAG: hypothetical protein QXG01_04270 [Candidatus Bathyarchaeia archaeon]
MGKNEIRFIYSARTKLENYIKLVKYFKCKGIKDVGSRKMESSFSYFTSKMMVDELKLHIITVEKHLSIIGKRYNSLSQRID